MQDQNTTPIDLHKRSRRGAKPIHGEARKGKKTAEFKAWRAMKDRCRPVDNPSYRNHGLRGIRVCERWATSYKSFLEDMGRKPGPEYSLERKDNNGNYEPDNCKWATRQEQQRNKRTNRLLTFKGETLTIAEWSERYSMKSHVIINRLNDNRDIERALTQPISSSHSIAALSASRARRQHPSMPKPPLP